MRSRSSGVVGPVDRPPERCGARSVGSGRKRRVRPWAGGLRAVRFRYNLLTGTSVMLGSILRYPPLSMIHGCSR
jgi:hypothetical protein